MRIRRLDDFGIGRRGGGDKSFKNRMVQVSLRSNQNLMQSRRQEVNERIVNILKDRKEQLECLFQLFRGSTYRQKMDFLAINEVGKIANFHSTKS